MEDRDRNSPTLDEVTAEVESAEKRFEGPGQAVNFYVSVIVSIMVRHMRPEADQHFVEAARLALQTGRAAMDWAGAG